MDSDTLQLTRSILYAGVGIMYILSARRYSAIVKVERMFTGLVFLCLTVAITLNRMGSTLLKPFNDSVLSTVTAMLFIVLVLLQLNGNALPFHRRKGE